MFNRLTRNIEFDNNGYASKYDNPRYQMAIQRRIKENAKKTRKDKFLNNEHNANAMLIIMKMKKTYWKEDKSNAENQDTFINKWYYDRAFDLLDNFEQWGSLTDKQVNFIYTFKDKMKINIDKANERNKEKLKSCFIGNIGEKMDLKLTITKVTSNDVSFSYYHRDISFKHDFIDDKGNLFVLFSTRNLLEENNNVNEIHLNCTIKEHKIFNNIKTTRIKLPKIIK